ncbi:MAG: sugar phosphate isomerase/epimerase family protein [Chitinophagaceae bacterium]
MLQLVKNEVEQYFNLAIEIKINTLHVETQLMQLLFFCPRWGQDHIPWDEFAKKTKQSGYDGVESGLNVEGSDDELMLYELNKYDLQFIGQHWQTITPDFEQHYNEYEKRLRNLAAAKPLFINSQTGKDYYSFEQNKQLIDLASAISTETGIPIIHETHRGKFSFAAHITKDYLQKLPELKITLDISHWCTTAESLLDDQRKAVDLAIARTEHIHARVGFPQGPQITDPRSPEWNEALQFHLSCWDKVVERKRKEGTLSLTITPEFGPYPYMVHFPLTNKPITDQWDINSYMMNMLRKRFE